LSSKIQTFFNVFSLNSYQKSNIKYTAKDTIQLGKISIDRKFLQMQNNLILPLLQTRSLPSSPSSIPIRN
ncbi:MAG: hypothetical protein ACE5GV_09455, partial [Candidatus Scalindua sp.]